MPNIWGNEIHLRYYLYEEGANTWHQPLLSPNFPWTVHMDKQKVPEAEACRTSE